MLDDGIIPVSVQIRRSRSFNEISCYGRNAYSTKQEKRINRRGIQLFRTIDPVPFPYFDRSQRSLISFSSFPIEPATEREADRISYSCNIVLLLFYHRLDLIRGKFHLFRPRCIMKAASHRDRLKWGSDRDTENQILILRTPLFRSELCEPKYPVRIERPVLMHH